MQIKNSTRPKSKPGPGQYNLDRKQIYKGTFDKDDRIFEKMTLEEQKSKMKNEKQHKLNETMNGSCEFSVF